MSTDVSHPATPPSASPATVVVPIHQGPVASGIRLPVERITVDELERRRQAAAAPPPLPNNVEVLQAMIRELRQALADQKQRVEEVEQAMDALLRRLQRSPRDVWSADQPALFPEIQATAVETPPVAAPPATDGAPDEPGPAPPHCKRKGHGRRSLEELLARCRWNAASIPSPRPSACVRAAAGRAARSASKPVSNWNTSRPSWYACSTPSSPTRVPIVPNTS